MPAKAKGGTAGFDFSRSLQKLTPESFYRFVAEYPNQEATSVYVYRVRPVIDRKLAGVKDSNIDIIPCGPGKAMPIDDEYLLREHGSGKYHLKFSDGNKGRGLTEVAKCTVDLYDPNCPPRLNPVELVVGAEGNDRFVQQYIREGWTVEDNKLVPPPSKGSDGILAKAVVDLANRQAQTPPAGESRVMERIVDLLEKRSDGAADFDRALQLAERLKPQSDPLQVELMKALVGKVAHGDAPPPRTGGQITELKEAAAFFKEMGWGAPAAAGSGGSWVDAIAALPGILQFGAEMLKQLALMRVVEAHKVVPINGAPGLPAMPAAPTAPEATTGEDDDMQLFGKLGFNLAELKAVGEDALDAYQRGVTGHDFAVSLVVGRRNGENLFNTICELGKEQLLQLFGMMPGLAEQIAAPGGNIEKWLDEFLAYGDEPGAAVAPPGKVA